MTRWEVRQGDALDVLRSLEAGSVSAIVTDPPYGIADKPMLDLPGRGGRGNNTYHPASEWDAAIDPAWAAECCRVAPLVVWFGHWRKRAEVEAAMTYPIRAEIVWAKDTHVGPPCPVAMQDERIWVFSAEGIKAREFATSVWSVPIIPTWAHRHHKNEKPVPLMQKAVRTFTDPGAFIVDPFMGSGTTGVACVREGRRFLGVDRAPEHVETARRRLTGEAEQRALFPTEAA
jgi:site-specific DNA-methyltransferase (adenine-specific)